MILIFLLGGMAILLTHALSRRPMTNDVMR